MQQAAAPKVKLLELAEILGGVGLYSLLLEQQDMLQALLRETLEEWLVGMYHDSQHLHSYHFDMASLVQAVELALEKLEEEQK